MKFFSIALATLTLGANLVLAAQDPMVGGAKMYANKDIVDNAVNSADHTTLVAAVKAAGLVEERRESNRIFYSLVEERLANAVGNFLSNVCPEQVVIRHKRKKSSLREV